VKADFTKATGGKSKITGEGNFTLAWSEIYFFFFFKLPVMLISSFVIVLI